MTGAVIGIGIINSEYLSTDTRDGYQTKIDYSSVDTSSSDTYLVSAQGVENKNRDSEITMRSNSQASSMTSTTEPLIDVDGEEDIDDGNRAITEDVNPNPRNTERRRTAPPDDSKKLRFSTLSIREYPRVLGDNVTTMGPPISLSWQYEDEIVYEIEDYEQAIQDTRRTQSELKMPSSLRDTILREMGYSRGEIQDAVKSSNIARNRRKRTNETLNLQPLQEAFEKVVRIGKSPFRRNRRSSP